MPQVRISRSASFRTNDLAKMVDTSDEWILERTGIRERRIADERQAASDLAYEASKIALERAGLGPDDIDVIIIATVTGDMPFPATACFLQDKLGARNAVGFDINAACSGFLYGLYVADAFLKSGDASKGTRRGNRGALEITNWDDRATCVLFGDGAGAVIVDRQMRTAGYSQCTSIPTEECGISSTYPEADRGIPHRRKQSQRSSITSDEGE